MELVGEGSDINGATPSSFSVSVVLLASVERFVVPVCGIFLIAFSGETKSPIRATLGLLVHV